MKYSIDEFMQYIEEEDVKFIRLAFCDIYGNPKNISVMSRDLRRVLEHGLAINASFIDGFGDGAYSDLFLHPDPSTTALLPWRPEQGKVIRMFCDIKLQDGTPFECDTRYILKQAIAVAEKAGVNFTFGSRTEFYLFKTDDEGNATLIPNDEAGYMDTYPKDKSENVRREICLTLERMGINPTNSHHEAGPGQNEIDYTSSDALTAADNAFTFNWVVKTIAARNGLSADFSPKPLKAGPGNGFHINLAAEGNDGEQILPNALAGILERIKETTLFFNRVDESYERLGSDSAPKYISWSSENSSQLVRIPPISGIKHHYASLRSPDPMTNPYLAFAILIYAGLEGISDNKDLTLPENVNLNSADSSVLEGLKTLPATLQDAKQAASESDFVKKYIPESILNFYCK